MGDGLGHEKADAGGSGLTFLREHHKNCSNKALIVTFKFKQTPETEQTSKFRRHHLRHILYITDILQIYPLAIFLIFFFIQTSSTMQRAQHVHCTEWCTIRTNRGQSRNENMASSRFPCSLFHKFTVQYKLDHIDNNKSCQEFTVWYKVKWTGSIQYDIYWQLFYVSCTHYKHDWKLFL